MNGIFSASTGHHEVNTVHIALPQPEMCTF